MTAISVWTRDVTAGRDYVQIRIIIFKPDPTVRCALHTRSYKYEQMMDSRKQSNIQHINLTRGWPLPVRECFRARMKSRQSHYHSYCYLICCQQDRIHSRISIVLNCETIAYKRRIQPNSNQEVPGTRANCWYTCWCGYKSHDWCSNNVFMYRLLVLW